MGHQINQPARPRRGSKGFIPRVRAKRAYSRINKWGKNFDSRLLGFAAYKAGMTQITFVDNTPNSPTKGDVICIPVTILDAPKTFVSAIRFYNKDIRQQLRVAKEIWAENLDKDFSRKITVSKKPKKPENEFSNVNISEMKDVRVLLATLPKGRSGKKKPEIFEVAIGGKNPADKFEYAKTILGKELSVEDILKSGEQVDILAVTKGKGFQGVIKRYGAKLESKKTDKKRRGIASIAPDVPRKVHWAVAMPGQMGYHNRYDYNKSILKIGKGGLKTKSGFLNYGNIRDDYIIMRGSLPGPAKRLVRMRLAVRPRKEAQQVPEIIEIDGVVQ